MKSKNYEIFRNMIGAYFHQDMNDVYSSTPDAVEDIIRDHGINNLSKLINEIDDILIQYPDEEKLSYYIEEDLNFDLNNEAVGFPSYKEFLLYLKNEFQKHIDSQPKDETKK